MVPLSAPVLASPLTRQSGPAGATDQGSGAAADRKTHHLGHVWNERLIFLGKFIDIR